jgi:glycerophosphoryl diester phosphodiesterase
VESFYLDRPLNFAHRGASHESPENTLASFSRAAELGADGIEFDVQLSSDGEVVVIHDFGLETTTDGQGLVREKTLAELKELDAGSWFDPEFAGLCIPTLQELIDSVGHSLLLNVELKAAGVRDNSLALAVVRILKRNNLIDRVIVSSFNPLTLWRVKRIEPRIPTGLLYAPDLPFFLRTPWLRHVIRPDALHPSYSLIDTSYMSWARKHGYRVHTWTVDEPADMRRLARQGVDLIMTNRPDLLRQVLDGNAQ